MSGQAARSCVRADAGTQPFLRWPGGKQWLLRAGLSLPALARDATYFEPFLGGGSLFFALRPNAAVLSDCNSALIATYKAVRNTPRVLLSRLDVLANDAQTFAQLRSAAPKKQIDIAVRFLYLNRTAFAGMYRVNREGEFNVPYGRYTDRRLAQPERVLAASATLKSAILAKQDFSEVEVAAKTGDFVYLDPPYVTGHANNGFVRYNEHLFTWDRQIELAAMSARLSKRGVRVLVSNTAHADVLALYPGFHRTLISRRDQLSRDASRRGLAPEAILSNFKVTLGR
jgi:DNA adenine methylase